MKLDLILDPVGDKLSVTDMHLSPISPHAPYPKYSDENLLNYKHQDNIKMFYKNTEGTFFDSCINPDLKHDWVLLDNDRAGEKVAEYNLDAGPKCGQYSVYGKSIELFCPVWLEHVTDDMKINIVIESKGKKVASRFVTFEGVFKNYLYEYFQYVGLLDGCDDVISVDFGEKQAYVSGISLTSGNIVKQDISNIIYNLLYRERPLMEVDSMLINHFKNNHLISRQLFNFNLCFNLSDILSEYLTSFMYGNLINIKAEVYIGDNKLEVRDFYSNYEYISKSDATIYPVSDVVNSNTSDTKHNVLDYLRDYQYTEFINKNKYVQNIIHWSLLDNSDYIFNLYNRFGGYVNVNENGETEYGYISWNAVENCEGEYYYEIYKDGELYKLPYIKDWYNENKDELKDINSEIIENDKNAVNGWIDSAKNWYNENKDEIKDSVKEQYNSDKETIEDLYNKIKN
jgi:hypothetical protein